MIYTFSNAIFQNLNDDDLDLIDRIWSNSKGKNFLYIGDLNNAELIRSSSWFQSLRKSNQQQIELQFVASANINKKANKLIIEDENEFSLVEATEILVKPLTIILENMEYDAHFMSAIIQNYEEGKRIKEYFDKGWLVYHNGGGNNISNVINGMKLRFEENNKFFPKKSSIYIKAFVIIDSDKKFPCEEKVSEDKAHLLSFIEDNIPFHVLLKREIENYLPDEIYNEIHENNEFKEAYLSLNGSQKDYFDLEKALSHRNFNQLNEEIQHLYANLSEAYKKIFRKGGLEFYKDNGKKDNFKSRFSQLFLSKNISKENLENRTKSTNQNELREILQKINDLL